MQELDPFTMMFNPPYGRDLTQIVVDMIGRTIGVLRTIPEPSEEVPKEEVDLNVRRSYASIAMPMDRDDLDLVDVLDAIKEAARRCEIHAERIDERQSNDRITV